MGGKCVTIINKRLSVVCPDKKCPKFPFRLSWTHLSIFQLPVVLFCVLFVIHSPAWAGISSLYVDANGDSVFNPEIEQEKLTITFTTSDYGEDDQEYRYEIYAIRLSYRWKISQGPATNEGQKLLKNQTVEFIWDGTDADGEPLKLNDGVYTIEVVLKDIDPNVTLPATLTTELTIEATLDKTDPKIEDVSVGYSEFSPIFDSVPVYYTLSEDVAEAWLEIERAGGGGDHRTQNSIRHNARESYLLLGWSGWQQKNL